MAFVLNNTLILGICCSTIPQLPGCFRSLDLLSEYRIQHGAIGPLYVTSSYSTWIFCRGVSGFATDCPCDVWCCGLSTCLLHVGPTFGNRFLNTSWAVGLTDWIVYFHFFFCILTYAIIYLDTSYHFLALSLLLKYSLFFSSTPVLTSSIDVVFVLSMAMAQLRPLSEWTSQIISLTIVFSTVYSDADQRKKSKLRFTGLCAGNSPETGEFPAQMASYAENVSIW